MTEKEMTLHVIAYAHNGHTDKFGIPRQSREQSPIVTRIVFEPEFAVPEALRGIEGYSHLWLLWGFSENRVQNADRFTESERTDCEWSPTVRPPRLGGNTRMGVFATRSPFRPNPIGLSSVRLIGIEQTAGSRQLELIVSGADLLDGTPIYDIKPYLSFTDSHPDAINGFAEAHKDHRLQVSWELISRSRLVNGSELTREWLDAVSYVLAQDPRPAYQDDPAREYKMDYGGYTITFFVENETVYPKNIEKVRK